MSVGPFFVITRSTPGFSLRRDEVTTMGWNQKEKNINSRSTSIIDRTRLLYLVQVEGVLGHFVFFNEDRVQEMNSTNTG